MSLYTTNSNSALGGKQAIKGVNLDLIQDMALNPPPRIKIKNFKAGRPKWWQNYHILKGKDELLSRNNSEEKLTKSRYNNLS